MKRCFTGESCGRYGVTVMIDCKMLVPGLIKKLREREFFKNITVVQAYSKLQKPTVPVGPVVVCGILSIHSQDVSLGQNIKAGEVSVFADICVPFHIRDFDFQEAAQEVFGTFCRDIPAGLSASEITVNTDMQCFVMRLTVTFSDALRIDL